MESIRFTVKTGVSSCVINIDIESGTDVIMKIVDENMEQSRSKALVQKDLK